MPFGNVILKQCRLHSSFTQSPVLSTTAGTILLAERWPIRGPVSYYCCAASDRMPHRLRMRSLHTQPCSLLGLSCLMCLLGIVCNSMLPSEMPQSIFLLRATLVYIPSFESRQSNAVAPRSYMMHGLGCFFLQKLAQKPG